MPRFTVIKDGRTLNALAKKYGMSFDYEHRYCTNEGQYAQMNGDLIVNGKHYGLHYFGGCFYPFVCLKHDPKDFA